MASPDPNTDKPASTTCPNCGQINTGEIIGIYQHKRDDKGKQFNPYSINNPIMIPKNRALNVAKNIHIQKVSVEKDGNMLDHTPNFLTTKKKKLKKPKRVRDEFISEEIKQCLDGRNVSKIIDKEEVMRSCVDLEIDG